MAQKDLRIKLILKGEIMSRYLRDGSLQYLTITASELDIISKKLKEIASREDAIKVLENYL